ncbi:MAG: type II CAAX endopeptidase family protein [bacterium]|nr:type II CAAX endopeptidase family protein [bacterium]
MNRLRSTIAFLAVVVLVVAIAWDSWPSSRKRNDTRQQAIVNETENNSENSTANSNQLRETTTNEISITDFSPEEAYYLKTSKALIGFLDYLKQRQLEPNSSPKYFADAENTLAKSFSSSSFRAAGKKEETRSEDGDPLLRMMKEINKKDSSRLALMKTIIAWHINQQDEAEKILTELEQAELNNEVEQRLLAITSALVRGSADSSTLEINASDSSYLGWVSQILEIKLVDDLVAQQSMQSGLDDATKYAFQKMVILFSCFIGLLICSITSLTVLALIYAFNLSPSFYSEGLLADHLRIETFALYLAVMFFGGQLIESVTNLNANIETRLILNVVMIISTLAVVLWPRLFGSSIRDIRETFALYAGGAWKLCRDLIAAFLAGTGATLPLLVILIAYAVILTFFEINVQDGAHPVVEVLSRSGQSNSNLVFYVIAFLAVIVAPLVEETMFRGVLYSWLRNKTSAFFAIVLSSLIFASIHPQGPIGIFPLTCIGMLLASLREWRNSLIPSMICHAALNASVLSLTQIIF